MKIGILSIFDNNNIGNRLQNYALQETLCELGCDVVTIRNIRDDGGISSKINIPKFISEAPVLHYITGNKRHGKIVSFTKKYIKTSKSRYFYNRNYSNIDEKCDMYCAGSDQVWNPNIKRSSYFNFLGFSKQENNFSYAASFGVDSIDEEYNEALKNGLNNISNISVREKSGVDIVKEISGKEAQLHIDPVLLLDDSKWIKIAKKPKKLKNEKFILCYFLGNISEQRQTEINNFAKRHNCEIVNIMDESSPYYLCGPQEFIYLEKNAFLICTDSFHSSVFSFIFNRPFVIFAREDKKSDMSTRLDNLFELFSINANYFNGKISDDMLSYDYTESYEILKKEQQKSLEYLKSIIASKEDKND